MNVRAYVLPMLTIFVLVGAFGAFALMGPMHAEMGCPFMLGQTAICGANTLAHVSHWQIAFASILIEILSLGVLLLAYLRRWELSVPDRVLQRIRIRSRVPDRPTLLQELFSRGLLNPKVF